MDHDAFGSSITIVANTTMEGTIRTNVEDWIVHNVGTRLFQEDDPNANPCKIE